MGRSVCIAEGMYYLCRDSAVREVVWGEVSVKQKVVSVKQKVCITCAGTVL